MNITGWRWWTLALRGLAAVALGLLSVLAPGVTFVSVVLTFGIYALVDGVLAIALAPRGELRVPMIVRGAVSFLAGVLAVAIMILAFPGSQPLAKPKQVAAKEQGVEVAGVIAIGQAGQ